MCFCENSVASCGFLQKSALLQDGCFKAVEELMHVQSFAIFHEVRHPRRVSAAIAQCWLLLVGVGGLHTGMDVCRCPCHIRTYHNTSLRASATSAAILPHGAPTTPYRLRLTGGKEWLWRPTALEKFQKAPAQRASSNSTRVSLGISEFESWDVRCRRWADGSYAHGVGRI